MSNINPQTASVLTDTISITESTADSYHSDDCYTSSVDLSSLMSADTITLSSITSPYTHTGAMGAGFSNTVYTTSMGAGGNVPWMTSTPGQMSAPKIQLNGEGADVEVNGWSLVAAVKSIEERLGLLQPNPELEQEWSDLRELGEQYRKLEQHIKDKQATFDRLKAMPAPEID
jgi:hypothetical protein